MGVMQNTLLFAKNLGPICSNFMRIGVLQVIAIVERCVYGGLANFGTPCIEKVG